VLRTRPAKSAEKYRQIWSATGSPLAVHTARQAQLLASSLKESRVEHAMRYGQPSIEEVLEKLRGCQPVTVLPLYPQYSDSATGSVIDAVKGRYPVVRDFHDHPAYIAALAATVTKFWEKNTKAPMLLMSFHGLPKRGGETYERQCHATGKLLAEKLGLKDGEWRVTFQSRFGFAKWLEPYTQATLLELARGGTKRVDVVFPGFVSDCLETLEEIGISAKKEFLAAGGEELRLVPCLNEAPEWIVALAAICTQSR
jgi:protoporphyrin/coproporphyrin ferrochelatase